MEHIHHRPMTGRTVLVTGATSGIGRATARGLARLGARVAITGRDRGRTQQAAGEITAAGGRIVGVFVADLSSQAQVRRLRGQDLHQGRDPGQCDAFPLRPVGRRRGPVLLGDGRLVVLPELLGMVR